MTAWIALAIGLLIGLAVGTRIRPRAITSRVEDDAQTKSQWSSAADSPVLIGMSPPIEGKSVRVTAHGLMIGRDADVATFCIADDDGIVSRTHCEVAWDVASRTFVVTDVGSKNGTKVEGVVVCEPGVPTHVLPEAILLVGASRIRVKMEIGSE